jgi:hypothetical protein
MFAKATNVGFAQRVVATLVACAMVLWSLGAYSEAQAANLTLVRDTLSTSAPAVASDHTIDFTVPLTGDGLIATEAITITFPTGFDITPIAFGDVDLSINTTDQTLAAAPAGATWGVSKSGQDLIITSGTGTLSPGDVVEVQVGTNAAGGTNQVTNPAIGSYEFVITAGSVDTGRTRVAIVNTVLVTAIVQTTFDFTITGLATSTAVNGETTTGSTSDTQIPFGVLTAGAEEVLGQRLNVTTNAQHGFVVTVEQDGNLRSANGADIDGFIDGAYTNVPAAWPALAPDINQENTWGHWGLTSDDADLNSDEFGSSLFVAASTTPREIFAHNGPADGSTANMGSTTVAYKIEISGLQEAADDYSTTLTYIATPTF